MLAEIYGLFTEGFDTADLQEAKALLRVTSPMPVFPTQRRQAPWEKMG